MRTSLLTAVLAFLLTNAVPPACAQDAAKVVDQYIKAEGGSKALSRIQTLTLEGTFTTADGQSGTYTFNTKLPNRYYSELLVGGQTMIEAYNRKSAWHQNAAGEISTMLGAEGAQLE